jgi:hypothetical protein
MSLLSTVLTRHFYLCPEFIKSAINSMLAHYYYYYAPLCTHRRDFLLVACLAPFLTCFPPFSPLPRPLFGLACVPHVYRLPTWLFPFLPLLSAVSHAWRTSGGHFPCFQPRGSPHVLLLRVPLADVRCLSPSGPRPVLKVEICQSQGAQPFKVICCHV